MEGKSMCICLGFLVFVSAGIMSVFLTFCLITFLFFLISVFILFIFFKCFLRALTSFTSSATKIKVHKIGITLTDIQCCHSGSWTGPHFLTYAKLS